MKKIGTTRGVGLIENVPPGGVRIPGTTIGSTTDKYVLTHRILHKKRDYTVSLEKLLSDRTTSLTLGFILSLRKLLTKVELARRIGGAGDMGLQTTSGVGFFS